MFTRSIIYIVFFLSWGLNVSSVTLYYGALDGSGVPITNSTWNNINAWSLTQGGPSYGQLPSCGDDIVIPAGIKVTISEDVDLSSNCTSVITIALFGELYFEHPRRLDLPCSDPSSVIIVHEGGIVTAEKYNNSTYIAICKDKVWSGGDDAIVGPAFLPIILLDFTAEAINSSISIEWITSTEINNDYFTVQRSVNGFDFEDISTVDGEGNSNYIVDYSIEDYTAPKRLVYYRLMQTDFDGKFTYSKVISVSNVLNTNNSVKVYPNPNNGEFVNITSIVEDVYNIVIINSQGVQVFNTVMYLNNNTTISFSNKLASGVYFLSITNSFSSYKNKLIVK